MDDRAFAGLLCSAAGYRSDPLARLAAIAAIFDAPPDALRRSWGRRKPDDGHSILRAITLGDPPPRDSSEWHDPTAVYVYAEDVGRWQQVTLPLRAALGHYRANIWRWESDDAGRLQCLLMCARELRAQIAEPGVVELARRLADFVVAEWGVVLREAPLHDVAALRKLAVVRTQRLKGLPAAWRFCQVPAAANAKPDRVPWAGRGAA